MVEVEEKVEEEEVDGVNFGEIGEPPSQSAPAAGDAARTPFLTRMMILFNISTDKSYKPYKSGEFGSLLVGGPYGYVKSKPLGTGQKLFRMINRIQANNLLVPCSVHFL